MNDGKLLTEVRGLPQNSLLVVAALLEAMIEERRRELEGADTDIQVFRNQGGITALREALRTLNNRR